MVQQGMVRLGHDFTKFIDPKYYADIIANNDDVGSILRLQLISERFLEVYLLERIPEESETFFPKDRNGTFLKYFNEKLMVAIAYGLPTQLGKSLKLLNKIRNNFGHDFEKTLSQSELDSYIILVDNFKHQAALPYLGEGPIKEMVIQSDGKRLTTADGLAIGFVIATFSLMTKAGLWLVSDLQSRGKLKIG
ncbi:hypothetical protein [Pseudomonas syringae group genomosp. 3]|uniref:hypothetical protein n=1 Tax=Pseudomonas syringae group genomosp. 3 TaxID=251701 RepID=UPI00070BD8BD|nr:hypothetical protein [Pseudomonas syringae group genomosp. 3]